MEIEQLVPRFGLAATAAYQQFGFRAHAVLTLPEPGLFEQNCLPGIVRTTEGARAEGRAAAWTQWEPPGRSAAVVGETSAAARRRAMLRWNGSGHRSPDGSRGHYGLR
jgi:hypothetical protein